MAITPKPPLDTGRFPPSTHVPKADLPGQAPTPCTSSSPPSPRTKRLNDSTAPAAGSSLSETVLQELRELLATFSTDGTALSSTSKGSMEISGFLLWMMAGVRLFCRPTHPSLQEVTGQARRVLLVLAQVHCRGNISTMATRLGTSRRTIRNALRRHGLYQGSTATSQAGGRQAPGCLGRFGIDDARPPTQDCEASTASGLPASPRLPGE